MPSSATGPGLHPEQLRKTRARGQQLWLLDLRGGQPGKVTRLGLGLIGYDWVDNNHFLILAREPKTLRELKEKDKKDDSIVYEDQEQLIPRRLFIYNFREKTWAAAWLNGP